jgi:YidC/Oxa1 family membrane protein insertase
MNTRAILAVALSFIVVFIYNYFYSKNLADKKQQTVQTESSTPSRPDSNDAALPAKDKASSIQTVAKPKAAVPGRDIQVETPLYSAIFNTKGGTLKSFRLKKYRKNLTGNGDTIELVRVGEGYEPPLGVKFFDSNVNVPVDSVYESPINSLDITNSPDPRQLIFVANHPGQIKIEKIYTFHPEKYSFDLEVSVHNLSADPISENAFLIWNEYIDPNAKTGGDGDEYNVVSFVKKSINRKEVAKLDSKEIVGPDVSWGAYETKYFIAAMIPKQPSLTSLITEKDAAGQLAVSLEGPKNLIPVAQTGSFNYTLYLGPKDLDLLKQEGVELEKAINIGSWIQWLAMPFLILMKFLYKYIPNYGLVILILTLLTKIIFWPLGTKSYKSMKEMQNLQPKINEIRERYKDDKAQLNQAVMNLYKTHKVNPMGGCLPMLIQVPVFIALYQVLMYAIELRHSPFFWWIQDLSAKDPYYITPIIMGASMFIQQKMTPAAGDPMQQKMMLIIMPIVMTFVFLNFPSGLVVYWLFNNILSIGQQYYINKVYAE